MTLPWTYELAGNLDASTAAAINLRTLLPCCCCFPVPVAAAHLSPLLLLLLLLQQADILNRGFGGFNTKTALLALPEILDMLSKQQIALAIVWLGANDAAVPEGSE